MDKELKSYRKKTNGVHEALGAASGAAIAAIFMTTATPILVTGAVVYLFSRTHDTLKEKSYNKMVKSIFETYFDLTQSAYAHDINMFSNSSGKDISLIVREHAKAKFAECWNNHPQDIVDEFQKTETNQTNFETKNIAASIKRFLERENGVNSISTIFDPDKFSNPSSSISIS